MDVKPTRQIGERIAADSEQEIEIQRREQLIHRVAEYNKRHSLDLFRLHLSDVSAHTWGAELNEVATCKHHLLCD